MKMARDDATMRHLYFPVLLFDIAGQLVDTDLEARVTKTLIRPMHNPPFLSERGYGLMRSSALRAILA